MISILEILTGGGGGSKIPKIRLTSFVHGPYGESRNQAVATCQKKVAGVSRQTAYVLHDVTHLRDTFA